MNSNVEDLISKYRDKESRALSRRITVHSAFTELGYADAAILNSAAGKHLIFTDDGPLQGMAWSIGVDVLPYQWLHGI